MSEDIEYRCFIGNLSWATTDRGLKDAFEKFGNLLDAKVAVDKFSGRSRGFGFVSFDDKAAMEEAIEAMNGMDLDGRNITVDKAKPHQGSGRDSDGDRSRDHGRDHDRDRNRGYDSGRGSHGWIVMVEVVAAAMVVMVLTGMEIDLVGAAGMEVVVGVLELEVIDIIVIVLDHMSVVELEVIVHKMTDCADELGLLLLCSVKQEVSFLHDMLFVVVWVEQYNSSVL
ncbi:hypothetical protein PVK06_047741 [Gossypium arboreum]|uniref:RRM domain-containing protein n=1 Tax=Gossypium arboreum TaxID=29729 RepID=A0ABR0MEK2_GOSAR|nr:hypothetical protein PVK06_047741 [Gossypium arboreum]